MTIGTKIRSGALWMFMGRTGSQLLSFAFGVVLARLLAPDVFGMLLTIQIFTGIANFVAGGGMGQALVRAKDASRADYDIVFSLQLAIGCVIYALFFVTAPLIAAAYNAPLYADMVRVMALSFIFRPFSNVPASILHREMRFKGMTVVGLSTLVLSSSISIALAHHGFGVWALILGGLVSPILTIPAFGLLAKWRPRLSFDFRRARELARYGFLVSINDIVNHLRDQVSIFILSRTLGPASIGLYNKGESLAKMPHSFITGSVYQVLFRALASEQDNLDKCRYLFFRSIALVAVYATPFYIGLLWLAEPLVRGLYGEKWVGAAGPLLILAFAWPFWLMENLSGSVLAAHNWLHRELPVQVSMLLISALAVLGALRWGIEGVAWAIVSASVYSAFHLYWLATRCLRARLDAFLSAVGPAALLNVILAVALALLSHALPEKLQQRDLAHVAVMALSGGLVYVVCFLYLPIPALQTEQERWKAKMRLARIPA